MLYSGEKSLKPFTFALLFNKFFIEGEVVKVEGISKLQEFNYIFRKGAY